MALGIVARGLFECFYGLWKRAFPAQGGGDLLVANGLRSSGKPLCILHETLHFVDQPRVEHFLNTVANARIEDIARPIDGINARIKRPVAPLRVQCGLFALCAAREAENLQGTHNAAHIVGVQACSAQRVGLCQHGVQACTAVRCLSDGRQFGADGFVALRRKAEGARDGVNVQPCATADDG